MAKLALLGGEPIRKTPFPEWPFYQTKKKAEAMWKVVAGVGAL